MQRRPFGISERKRRILHLSILALRIMPDMGLLMLRVTNAYAGRREEKADGLFATTKADRRAHGFGLRGMREIAARNGGTLETTAKDGVFELVACLPLNK